MRNQIAIMASKIMQPHEEVRMKGQIGFPHQWWAKSHTECISHATPIKRYDFPEDDRQRNHGIDKLPQSQAATQVRAAQ